MKKRYAFLISFLATLLIAGNYLFLNAKNIFPEREIVVISRVIDGDTVELEDGRTIRLLNINTPEKNQAFSEKATDFLREYENKTVELEVEGVGSYGRILGRLYSGDYLNLEIVELGLAHKYLVGEDELEEFEKAETAAREKELGIWEKSNYYGCLNVEINKKEEYVTIESECDTDLNSWTLKDESTRDYEFDKIINVDRFTFYSEKGTDNEEEFYWGRGKAWNDDKDSIFIRDKDGYLVFYDSYGY